jgi:uncharacterized phage protein (TIGR01671 family)
MREILFKAKREDNSKWVEGNYVKKYDLSGKRHLILYVDNYVRWKCVGIDPKTLCQFTGLYDKNDKRIWENDIVNTDSNVRAQVKFGLYYNSFSIWKRNQGFYMDFMNKECYRPDLGYWAKKTVVIGNIFDNPEVAKEE